MTMNLLDQATLDKIVGETIPDNLPNGHRNAIVATVDVKGAKVAAVLNNPDPAAGFTWSLKACYEHDWDGTNDVGVSWVGSF